MGFFNTKSSDAGKIKSASLSDVLTKGQGRTYIPKEEKRKIAEALIKSKGSAIAQSYLKGEKSVSQLKDAMRVLEKEGIFKEYEGTGVLKKFIKKEEIKKRNIAQLIRDEAQREKVVEMLEKGDLPIHMRGNVKKHMPFLSPEQKKKAIRLMGKGVGINGVNVKSKGELSKPPTIPLAK